MGYSPEAASSSSSPSQDNSNDSTFLASRRHLEQELENLTLTAQPLKTLKLFVLAVASYIHQSVFYLKSKLAFLVILGILAAAPALLLLSGGPYEKHIEELSKYLQFGLWWVALGVASSIGLGSGLHTFVLYLGPHIAFFTIKAMQCGRVDLKSAPYDTIQFKRGPSWLNKDCSEFGFPLFTSQHGGARVPLSSILPEVQIEAILWGIGTALGELPPYFISRAARLSGGAMDEAMEEIEVSSSKESGIISRHLADMKRWLLSHSQHLNFSTILVLASVPNPLFDLAGIMCGQFGIPFWKFFLATFIGKAIIKTHIQTILIISVCNNQLLKYVENMIMLLGFIPGVSSFLPGIISRVNAVRDKYLTAPTPIVTSNIKVKKWDLSFGSIWNTVVWLVLINFFAKIVTATAQNYMKKQRQEQEKEKNEKMMMPSLSCSN